MDAKKLIIIAGNHSDYLVYIKRVELTEEETIYTENLAELMGYSKFYYIFGKNWGRYPHIKGSPFNCSFKSKNYRIKSVQEWRDK